MIEDKERLATVASEAIAVKEHFTWTCYFYRLVFMTDLNIFDTFKVTQEVLTVLLIFNFMYQLNRNTQRSL